MSIQSSAFDLFPALLCPPNPWPLHLKFLLISSTEQFYFVNFSQGQQKRVIFLTFIFNYASHKHNDRQEERAEGHAHLILSDPSTDKCAVYSFKKCCLEEEPAQ